MRFLPARRYASAGTRIAQTDRAVRAVVVELWLIATQLLWKQV